MATRDLSPSAWVAPGTGRLGLSVIQSAVGSLPFPLDVWLSNYSPLYDETITLASGFNAITNPDTTNCRIFILIPPRGNAQTITLKGVTGDTGLAQNPNGVIILTLPATSAPASIGITAGASIAGTRVIFL